MLSVRHDKKCNVCVNLAALGEGNERQPEYMELNKEKDKQQSEEVEIGVLGLRVKDLGEWNEETYET